ncbi:MAG: hypothetical protein V3V92_05380 [Candidatus Hydrothermarchaeales archaeon]
MARIISFSIPEDWELTDEVMEMSSSQIREVLMEGVKILKEKEKNRTKEVK